MTRIFDVSARFPEDRLGALRKVLEHLRTRGSEPFVVGALARDIVTGLAGGSTAPRATLDIDLAVSIETPRQFAALLSGLDRSRSVPHRVVVDQVVVDLVPFGGIAISDTVVFGESALDVSGLVEASATSVRAIVGQNFEVNVASLPALCVLKTLAWRDRRTATSKDAVDLAHLLLAASEAPYLDELLADEQCLIDADYDLIAAGALRAGLEARTFLEPRTLAIVLEVLSEWGTDLADDMKSALAPTLVEEFERGLRSRRELI